MNGQINLRDLWRWRIVRTLESIGRRGWLGLGAVVLAIILSMALLRGLSQKTQALEQEIRELRQGRSGDGHSAILLQLLPDHKASIEFPAFLHLVSSRHGIRVDRMEYQLTEEPGKPLLLYRVDLVGIGGYLSLRNWLDEILKERPTVAIDDLVLERPNSNLNEVTARVRLTLYMKGGA